VPALYMQRLLSFVESKFSGSAAVYLEPSLQDTRSLRRITSHRRPRTVRMDNVIASWMKRSREDVVGAEN
jgi:uridine kinase